MYGLTLLESSDHVYEEASIKDELKIKTHYESLDIAQSNKVHYIRFTLPNEPLADFDEQLQERIKNYEEEVN